MQMKRGQIWVETVLYTLIGLTLIGVVLALATPRINESRDRIIVEQSIESLNVLDEKISEVLDRGGGNVRKISIFTMRRGSLTVDPPNNLVIFFLDDLTKPYSQPGESVKVGRISIFSEEGGKKSSVRLQLNYTGVANLTYDGGDVLKKFVATTTPYSFSVENKGKVGGLIVVDVRETSRG